MEAIDLENLPISVKNEDNRMDCNREYSDGLGLVNYRVQLPNEFSVDDQIEFNDENFNITDTQNNMDDGNDVVFSYLCPSDDILFEDLLMEVKEDNPMTSKECLTQTEDKAHTEHEQMCKSIDNIQFQLYLNWLDSVIETTNLVLDFNNDGYPEPLKFSVPHVSVL